MDTRSPGARMSDPSITRTLLSSRDFVNICRGIRYSSPPPARIAFSEGLFQAKLPQSASPAVFTPVISYGIATIFTLLRCLYLRITRLIIIHFRFVPSPSRLPVNTRKYFPLRTDVQFSLHLDTIGCIGGGGGGIEQLTRTKREGRCMCM